MGAARDHLLVEYIQCDTGDDFILSLTIIYFPVQESSSIYGELLGAVSDQLSVLFRQANNLQMVSVPSLYMGTMGMIGLQHPIAVPPFCDECGGLQ